MSKEANSTEAAPKGAPASPGTAPAAPQNRRGVLPEGDASLYLHPQTLARLGTFELRAKMIVEGVMSGTHRSPYHGFSVEFAQHRPYVAGDDIRHLDWKVYGRTDKLHLKQYQQETNLDLMVLVDSSGSMDFGSRSFEEASGVGRKTSPDGRPYWSKFDHATAIAAAIAYITLQQGDRVGLLVYADEVRAQLKRSSAQGVWRQIVGALSTHPVDRPTNLPRAVEQAMSKLTNRCLIAIISDLFVDLDQLKTTLARVRHRGHDAILFQVLDRAELVFDLHDEAPFIGLEGEGQIKIDPRAIRPAYLEALRAHLEGVERLSRAFGFDHQVVSTHDWLGPTLASFVASRNAQIKRSKHA